MPTALMEQAISERPRSRAPFLYTNAPEVFNGFQTADYLDWMPRLGSVLGVAVFDTKEAAQAECDRWRRSKAPSGARVSALWKSRDIRFAHLSITVFVVVLRDPGAVAAS